MSTHIYLSVMPEALIGSMLAPAAFGAYLSTGTKKRNKGQSMFIEIDFEKAGNVIDKNYLKTRCVAKPDGSPKSSVYLSVYRVLESIPMNAFKSLYLTTENGIVLELEAVRYDKKNEEKDQIHLYQELCPVSPQIASSHTPSEYIKALTDGSLHIKLPKIFFVDMNLGDPDKNLRGGSVDYLPERQAEHLRDCIEILKNEENKQMKTVQRTFSGVLLYRTIRSGFYLGCKDEIIFYPFPSMKELENRNYEFFRAI